MSLRARVAAGAMTVLAATVTSAEASAQDKEPVDVSVTPNGQPWAVGVRGGVDCSPSCHLRLVPDTYLVTIGGAKEEILIRVPTEITYSAGSAKLRTIAGWTAVGSLAAGGIAGGFAIYGFAKSCTNGCNDVSFTVSRPTAEVLIAIGAGLISISVTGAILFALSGESLSARELGPAEDPARRRSFDVMFNPSGKGSSVSLVARF